MKKYILEQQKDGLHLTQMKWVETVKHTDKDGKETTSEVFYPTVERPNANCKPLDYAPEKDGKIMFDMTSEQMQGYIDETGTYYWERLLVSWDYKTSKRADGEYTDEEWAEIVAERKAVRDKIREIERLDETSKK